MQNSSPNQMKMLTTRIGTNSKMVITGDLNQTDIPSKNGLACWPS
jgi:phosphate starvation-inducible PhoH-like protein